MHNQTQQKTFKYMDFQFRLLHSAEQANKIIDRVAQQINQYYDQLLKAQEDPILTVFCVLKGGYHFYSQLIRLLNFRIDCEFIKVSSYQGMKSTGIVKLQSGPQMQKFKNKHILIVEGIIQTGTTLKWILDRLQCVNPKTINIAVLVRRTDKEPKVKCRFIGLQTNKFVVGCGLDLDQNFRQLPELYVLSTKDKN